MQLVEYKGGGYDGCFWEWNYFLLTNDGITHDVFSSGYKGAKTHQERLDRYNAPESNVYDLNVADEQLECFSGMNAGHAKGIADILSELFSIEVQAFCSECSNEFVIVNMIAGNWASDGGISYSPHDLFCEDCAYKEMA